jgi:hypothetical protein
MFKRKRADIVFSGASRASGGDWGDWELLVASGEIGITLYPTKKEIESLKELCEIMLEEE